MFYLRSVLVVVVMVVVSVDFHVIVVNQMEEGLISFHSLIFIEEFLFRPIRTQPGLNF